MININEKDFIETVTIKGLQVSLVASSPTAEVIHHRLESGTNWALEPEEGWNALEYLIVLKGKLRTLPIEESGQTINEGDSFFRHPVKELHTFQAVGLTEFLYVTSQPIFHRYSRIARDMFALVDEIEKKDGYTLNHCYRITKLSMVIGEAMGLTSEQLLKLNLGSFFHDVGKIRVPEEVLKKPGKLTSEEWTIMKQHPTIGRELLEECTIPVLASVAEVVEQHHERYDGKGYPKGLTGEEICIESAIISVVDSFDAMTTDRVYQKRRSTDYAIEELLRCRGTMYHPDVVDKFIELKDIIIGVSE
ncbi:HD-GYP domain-containing protein [Robertmurraya korlensis]|uniref:HD-GYP domain-containing protein n=1 Tax=Robertmurraya korlensis TaxID=519977 RepID=UPI000AE49602|nr:HD-GYP domain-containing protein [Robertmurraya korlensis]